MENRALDQEQQHMDAEDAAVRVKQLRSQMKEMKAAAAAAAAAKSAEKYRKLEMFGLKFRFYTLLEWPGANPDEVTDLANQYRKAQEFYADALNGRKLADARLEMVDAAFDAGVERLAYDAERTKQKVEANGKS